MKLGYNEAMREPGESQRFCMYCGLPLTDAEMFLCMGCEQVEQEQLLLGEDE